MNNQPRSISATSRAGSPAVAGPSRSPPAAPGTGVPVPLLRRCRLPPWGLPSGPVSVLGAETRAPSAGGGRGAGWVTHRCLLGGVNPPLDTKFKPCPRRRGGDEALTPLHRSPGWGQAVSSW